MICKHCGTEMIELVYADLGYGIKGVHYECPYNCELVKECEKCQTITKDTKDH